MDPTPAPSPAGWRPLYTAALGLAFALLLWVTLPVLSPVVAFLVLLVLAGPYVHQRPITMLVAAAALVLAVWLLEATGGLLAPFALAFVLAYVLDPAVDWLERHRLPRSLAILVLSLPVLLLLAAAVLFGIPALFRQVAELTAQAPAALEKLRAAVENSNGHLLGIDLPFVDERRLLEPLLSLDSARITELLRQRQQAIAEHAWDAVMGVGRGVGWILSLLGYVVLLPVLTFYLLRDFDDVTARLRELVPPAHRSRLSSFMGEYDDQLSNYLRGQLTEAAIVGVLTWLGLWLLGFPYAGLVGAVAGVFNVVPYLGLIVSLVPAVLIALLSGDVVASLIQIAIVFAVVQALDGTILGPRIVGGSVGLHPVVVILALALAGAFFGFVGLLIAVPAAILIKMALRIAIRRYRASSLFEGAGRA